MLQLNHQNLEYFLKYVISTYSIRFVTEGNPVSPPAIIPRVDDDIVAIACNSSDMSPKSIPLPCDAIVTYSMVSRHLGSYPPANNPLIELLIPRG